MFDEILENITDIHIRVLTNRDGQDADMDGSLIYPAIRCPKNQLERQLVVKLFEQCVHTHQRGDDFLVTVDGTNFRCCRDRRAIDGTWFRLRKMARIPPTLETVKIKLPESAVSSFLSPGLTGGGLILVTGGPGSGKTTTASAIIVSRLQQYGGVAFTVEDPPELPLNGPHNEGYCTQTFVSGDGANDWAESLRAVLRSQPVGKNLMLFVGELRDAMPAQIMLRAASNGFLVVCTSFGNDIISGVDTVYNLVGKSYAGTLANVLRVVSHQRFDAETIQMNILESSGQSHPVSNAIRNHMIPQLKDEILYQQNRMSASSKVHLGTRSHNDKW